MKNKTTILAISFTLLLSFLLGWISIKYLGEYGWTIFVLVPFLIGFLPTYLCSKRRAITKREAYILGFISLGLACLGLLVFAIEGIICILMTSPGLLFLTFLGASLGYSLQKNRMASSNNVTLLLVGTALGSLSFDAIDQPQALIPVRTTITIAAEPDRVWENVVRFGTIASPTDWIFKTGIAYPIDATIEGEGVGAIRYCNFTTGSFVEPITTWNAPHLLQFDVKEQPIPMQELNPFWEVHPPHLDGYFRSRRGQFKLTETEDHQTILEGTTWYEVDISPSFYWEIWSNMIIHKIHHRVLQHIKEKAEQEFE